MITVTHKTKTVSLTVRGDHPIDGWSFYFENTRTTEPGAALLAENLRNHLAGHIRQIKTAAYERGWKDAKAKRRKRGWRNFCGNWDADQ